jgi:peroxiredoxin
MQKLQRILVFAAMAGLLAGCWGEGIRMVSGEWTFVMNLGDDALPFRGVFSQDSLNYPVLTIYNGEEAIEAHEVGWKEDSLFVNLPHFESELHARMVGEGQLEGVWRNFAKGPDYAIPFVATARAAGCPQADEQTSSLAGRWETTFEDDGGSWPAIGEFRQEGSALRGTFLTETGDYRYLEGCVSKNEFRLSTFDGAHAFLFSGTIQVDGSLNGTFYSGNHYQARFTAVKNEEVSLRSADSLTYLKEGYDRLSFSFPDLEGKMVSLDDERFQNKAVIVQIMGSWCPNCLDESRLFAQWHKQYHDQGLELVALAFERSDDFEKAKKAVERFKKPLVSDYTFLIAGRANKKAAAEKLPMLNHIMSYPTSIWIDRDGNIRKIHTGFTGPGTGQHYEAFVEQYERLIEDMLR